MRTSALTSNVSIYTSITYNPLVLLLFRFQKSEKQPQKSLFLLTNC